MLTLSILPWIMALFANAESSRILRQRDATLQQVLHLVATAAGKNQTFSDFGNSTVHQSHYEDQGLFREPRDLAFALSTDGAQLTLKKQSNTWIVIIILLSLPGDMRYKSNGYWIPLATPGPNSPGDIESFLWTVFSDLAKASEGIWIWDAIDSSYFIL